MKTIQTSSAAELHLSGLIGTPSHLDMQKIPIIWYILEIDYIGSLKFGCYYLQYVPASNPFSHAWFEVLEAITLSVVVAARSKA